MNIKIECYGAIVQYLTEGFVLDVIEHSRVDEVLNQIKAQYPQASQLLDACACAIGEDMVSRQHCLAPHSTLVLLSPVAGG